MLINTRDDSAFQAYLDKEEQRLHSRLFPTFRAAIHMHISRGAWHGQAYLEKRGKVALLASYKRVYRAVYTQTHHDQKQARTGVGDFLSEQLSWLERRAESLIARAAQALADYIRNIIVGGVNKGLSNKEIARQILEDTPDISRSRAATIARTETHNSATSALDTSIQYQGIDIKRRQWWSVADQRVRPSHVEMHGVIVPYNEPFDTPDGPMRFPGDDSLGADAAGLINCRCVCLYHTED